MCWLSPLWFLVFAVLGTSSERPFEPAAGHQLAFPRKTILKESPIPKIFTENTALLSVQVSGYDSQIGDNKAKARSCSLQVYKTLRDAVIFDWYISLNDKDQMSSCDVVYKSNSTNDTILLSPFLPKTRTFFIAELDAESHYEFHMLCEDHKARNYVTKPIFFTTGTITANSALLRFCNQSIKFVRRTRRSVIDITVAHAQVFLWLEWKNNIGQWAFYSLVASVDSPSVHDLQANLTRGYAHDLSREEVLLPAISSSVVNGVQGHILSTQRRRWNKIEKVSPHLVLGEWSTLHILSRDYDVVVWWTNICVPSLIDKCFFYESVLLAKGQGVLELLVFFRNFSHAWADKWAQKSICLMLSYMGLLKNDPLWGKQKEEEVGAKRRERDWNQWHMHIQREVPEIGIRLLRSGISSSSLVQSHSPILWISNFPTTNIVCSITGNCIKLESKSFSSFRRVSSRPLTRVPRPGLYVWSYLSNLAHLMEYFRAPQRTVPVKWKVWERDPWLKLGGTRSLLIENSPLIGFEELAESLDHWQSSSILMGSIQ